MALNGLLCADVPLKAYKLTHSGRILSLFHIFSNVCVHYFCTAKYLSARSCFWCTTACDVISLRKNWQQRMGKHCWPIRSTLLWKYH